MCVIGLSLDALSLFHAGLASAIYARMDTSIVISCEACSSRIIVPQTPTTSAHIDQQALVEIASRLSKLLE